MKGNSDSFSWLKHDTRGQTGSQLKSHGGGRFAPRLLACGPWCTPSRSLVHTCAVRGWPEMILPLNTPAHHEGSNPYKNPTIEMTTACSSAAVRPCHPVTQLAELTRSSSWPQAPLHFFLPAAELHFFLPAGGLPKPSHRSTFWPAYVPPLASPCKIGAGDYVHHPVLGETHDYRNYNL